MCQDSCKANLVVADMNDIGHLETADTYLYLLHLRPILSSNMSALSKISAIRKLTVPVLLY